MTVKVFVMTVKPAHSISLLFFTFLMSLATQEAWPQVLRYAVADVRPGPVPKAPQARLLLWTLPSSNTCSQQKSIEERQRKSLLSFGA